jgi:hypothetical protein
MKQYSAALSRKSSDGVFGFALADNVFFVPCFIIENNPMAFIKAIWTDIIGRCI